MTKFQKDRRDPKHIWSSPIILFLLFIVVVIFMYNMIDIIEKSRETAKKKNFVANQVEDLKKRETILKKDIEKLNTMQGVEEEIREKYQMVKQGEKMVVILDEVENETSDNENTEQISGISRIWNNLFD